MDRDENETSILPHNLVYPIGFEPIPSGDSPAVLPFKLWITTPLSTYVIPLKGGKFGITRVRINLLTLFTISQQLAIKIKKKQKRRDRVASP